jgi:hypothetical protein
MVSAGVCDDGAVAVVSGSLKPEQSLSVCPRCFKRSGCSECSHSAAYSRVLRPVMAGSQPPFMEPELLPGAYGLVRPGTCGSRGLQSFE